MSSSELYSEQLYDNARDEGLDQDNWMSVVYDNTPLAYVRLEQEEMDLLRDEPGTEDYHDFLVKLDSCRDELPDRVGCLDSYNIIDQACEVNPSVLQSLAGEGFEREIDKEVMSRFDEKDRKRDGEIGDDFDMLIEGMDPIVESVVGGQLEEFKETMTREPILQEAKVVYGNSLDELYGRIHRLQTE